MATASIIIIVLSGHSAIEYPIKMFDVQEAMNGGACFYHQLTPPGKVTWRTTYETSAFVNVIRELDFERLLSTREHKVRLDASGKLIPDEDKIINISEKITHAIKKYHLETPFVTAVDIDEANHLDAQKALKKSGLLDSVTKSSFNPDGYNTLTTSGFLYNKSYTEISDDDPDKEITSTFPYGKNLLLYTNIEELKVYEQKSISIFFPEDYTLEDIINNFSVFAQYLVIFDMGCNGTMCRTGRSGRPDRLIQDLSVKKGRGNKKISKYRKYKNKTKHRKYKNKTKHRKYKNKTKTKRRKY